MDAVTVVLVGGPERLPERERIRKTADVTEKIKVQFAGGYEHFAYTGDSVAREDGSLPVFKWCGRTKLAE
ncbi:DUF5988 family protein [Nocardia sp. NPDC046473]|uniref:DUF5988 family protein n=1 Tax=Nocardia sp. NPDC046473 TaxID=3155733 RepID=UPI0033C0F51A